MSSIAWVLLASWHVLKFDDPRSTACGLEVGDEDEVLESLPPGFWQERSCENCFRKVMSAKMIWEATPTS